MAADRWARARSATHGARGWRRRSVCAVSCAAPCASPMRVDQAGSSSRVNAPDSRSGSSPALLQVGGTVERRLARACLRVRYTMVGRAVMWSSAWITPSVDRSLERRRAPVHPGRSFMRRSSSRSEPHPPASVSAPVADRTDPSAVPPRRRRCWVRCTRGRGEAEAVVEGGGGSPSPPARLRRGCRRGPGRVVTWWAISCPGAWSSRTNPLSSTGTKPTPTHSCGTRTTPCLR